MKKLIVILVALTTLSVGAFAEDGLWFGPTAIYDSPMNATSTFDPNTFDPSLLIYGADVKLKMLGILNLQALALYMPARPYTAEPDAVLTLLDAGLYLDLLKIVNVGIGVGPNFLFYTNAVSDPFKVGVNIRADVGIELGKIGLNLYGVMFAEDFSALQTVVTADISTRSWFTGLSLVFKL